MGAEVIDKVYSPYLADVIGSVSSVIVISPLSFSPVGEMPVTLDIDDIF